MASGTSALILLLLAFGVTLTEATDAQKIAETVLADLIVAQTKRVSPQHIDDLFCIHLGARFS